MFSGLVVKLAPRKLECVPKHKAAGTILTSLAEVEAGTHRQGSSWSYHLRVLGCTCEGGTCSWPISTLWAGKASRCWDREEPRGMRKTSSHLALELGSEDMLLSSR